MKNLKLKVQILEGLKKSYKISHLSNTIKYLRNIGEAKNDMRVRDSEHAFDHFRSDNIQSFRNQLTIFFWTPNKSTPVIRGK